MQIERLKQQLVEITADLQVKERELRNLRLKSLFDSPKRQHTESGKGDDWYISLSVFCLHNLLRFIKPGAAPA